MIENPSGLQRSYLRISRTSEFYDTFYEILTQDAQVAKHFEGVGEARRAFFAKTSIPTLIMYVMGSPLAEKRMRSLAKTHGRDQINVHPDLYEFWLETVIAMLWKYDEEFDEELEVIWRRAIRKGIEIFIDAY